MERKKRDMALAKSNDNGSNSNSNNSTSNKENKNNVVQIKRVNIASPSATDKDQLAPLEVAQKKPKRKPKFKKSNPALNEISQTATAGGAATTPRADDRLELPVIQSKTSTKASKTSTSSSLNEEHHQQQQPPPQPSSRISHHPKAKSPAAVPKETNNQKEPINNNLIIETISPPSTNTQQQQSLAKQHQQLQPNTPNSNASSTKPVEQKPVIAKIERPVIKEVKEPTNKMKRQVCLFILFS